MRHPFSAGSVPAPYRRIMSHRTTISRVLTVLVAALTSPAAAGAGIDPADCFAEWSDAAIVVREKALTPVRDLHTEARRRNLGDIVRVTLCTDRSKSRQPYVYRLLVREPDGRVVTLVVDAIAPFTEQPSGR